MRNQNDRLKRVIQALNSGAKKGLIATGKKASKRRQRAIKRSIAKQRKSAKINKIKREIKSYHERRNRKYQSGDLHRKKYFQRNLERFRQSVNKFNFKRISPEQYKENQTRNGHSEKNEISKLFSGDLDLLERGSANSYKFLRDRMKLKKQLNTFPTLTIDLVGDK